MAIEIRNRFPVKLLPVPKQSTSGFGKTQLNTKSDVENDGSFSVYQVHFIKHKIF